MDLTVIGGCECFNQFTKGFYDPLKHCEECKKGYGPNNEQEWRNMVEYQDLIFALTGIKDAVMNTNQAFEDVKCRYPNDASSIRLGKICNGVGKVDVNKKVNLFDIYMYDTTTTAACLQLKVNSKVFTNLLDTSDANIQTFMSGKEFINVIYYNGTVMNLIEEESVFIRHYDNNIQIECIYPVWNDGGITLNEIKGYEYKRLDLINI